MVMITQALDNAIGFFSPKTQLNRMAARDAISRTRSQYAAAKNSLSSGAWNPVDASVNTLMANSVNTLRSRARQLVRDMPAMSTAIDRLVDFMVGDGLTLQARVIDPATGKLAVAINQKIEDAWKWFCDEADAAGNLHMTEIQQLNARQDSEVGEYYMIKKHDKSPGRYIPFSLQLVEPDVLSSYGGKALAGNDIHQGVEYNKATGAAVAHHFDDGEHWSTPIRVPKASIVKGYKTLRPGQLRGVTPLAAAILLAHQLRDFLEAEISTAQKAARWLAFVTSADPAATMAAFGAAQSPTYTNTSGNAKYTMEMGHSIIDFLRTGEEVKIADHNRPGNSFEPFVKFMLRTFAATAGVTYELVSGDYHDAKYTSARVARNDMLMGLDVRRGRLIRQSCEPVRREFMDWAVLTGKLDLPGYFHNPAPYQRCVWLPPGMAALDPLREGRAESDAVDAKLKSPQEGIIARGRDPEQVLDEIQIWNQMCEDRNIDPNKAAKAALKTNPAAVGAK